MMNEVRNKNTVKTILLYLALCTAAFFNTIQDICSPFSHSMNFGDGAIYQYIGKMILNGESPYKDAFDHKGPVLYFINAISVVINEKTGIWLVDLAFMIILYLATFSLCRKICKKGMFTAAFLAIAVLSGTTNLYWIGNTPDFFALCIVMVETYVLVDAYEHNKMSFQKAFIIGILISLCFWMKFTTIALAGIFCLGVLIAYAVAKDGKSVANSIGGFLCGFLIVSFPIILWLYSNGAMDDFFKDYVYFNLFYGKMERAGISRLRALFYFITDGNYVIAICSTIVYLFVRCKNKGFFKDSKKKQDYLFVVAIIALIIQTIVCIMPGRSYRQYAAAYYPSFIILISMATKELVGYDTPEIKKVLKIAMAGVVGVLILPNAIKAIGYQSEFLPVQDRDKILEVIEPYSGEEIAVATPGECGLYIWNNCKSATTYPYVQADLGRDEDFWADYEKQLADKEPTIIVWTNEFQIDDCIPNVVDKYECIAKVNYLRVFKIKE